VAATIAGGESTGAGGFSSWRRRPDGQEVRLLARPHSRLFQEDADGLDPPRPWRIAASSGGAESAGPAHALGGGATGAVSGRGRQREQGGVGAAEGAGRGRARRRAQGRRWRRGGRGGGRMEGKMIKLKGIFAYIHAP